MAQAFQDAGFQHQAGISHDWVFGAVAELIDIIAKGGAHNVQIDVTRHGVPSRPMISIQADGGGLGPVQIRREVGPLIRGAYNVSRLATSAFRLGANILFSSKSQEPGKESSTVTLGLLSLTAVRENRISFRTADMKPPMIDYQVMSNGTVNSRLSTTTHEDWSKSLIDILAWSPFASEEELLAHFVGGDHGTKVLVYGLWCLRDGLLELDVERDLADIVFRTEEVDSGEDVVAAHHIGNIYRTSLRAYISILYREMQFCVVLRGVRVNCYSIVSSLTGREKSEYKPFLSMDGPTAIEGHVSLEMGFCQEVSPGCRGFNIYNQNRLIKPFWNLVQGDDGKGIQGIVETNVLEPEPNLQEFKASDSLGKIEKFIKTQTRSLWKRKALLLPVAHMDQAMPIVPLPSSSRQVMHLEAHLKDMEEEIRQGRTETQAKNERDEYLERRRKEMEQKTQLDASASASNSGSLNLELKL